jgi:EAL and modified HD-GYP domain-containing signal transduction protein
MASIQQQTPASAIYIGRQPIYDRDLNVIAYELLYRSSEQATRADVTDGEHATTHVLNNAFMEIGFDDLVGESKAFINMPRGFIVSEQTRLLPSDRVVIELLEDVEVDDEVVAAVTQLSQQGFTIALDDFVFHEKLLPLVRLANIIKIDLKELTGESLAQHVQLLKQHNVRLLAEKIETREQFDQCIQLGFDYFQGYFFSHPKTISGEKLPASHSAVLQLVARIYDPQVNAEELNHLIDQDATLSLKLLRVINTVGLSSACSSVNSSFPNASVPKQAESIKQALSMQGVENIRRWITMLSFAGIGDKPKELFRSTIIRARMCECLAQAAGAKNSEAYFTMGLFSNLDTLMDRPLPVIVSALPLSTEIKQALLERAGAMGEVLSCVSAYELGDWDHVVAGDLTPQQIRQAYAESLHWTHTLSKVIA